MYQSAASDQTSADGVSAKAPPTSTTGLASRPPSPNTISGTPTKWVAMLRRSRWNPA